MRSTIGGRVCYILVSLWAEFGHSATGTEIYQEDKIMTPKELYEWAVKNGCEDYNIKIEWGDEYSYGWSEVSKVGLIVTESYKTITIDI